MADMSCSHPTQLAIKESEMSGALSYIYSFKLRFTYISNGMGYARLIIGRDTLPLSLITDPKVFFFLIVCFTSYFVFSIAVLPHSPGVVYYHLLMR